MIKNTRKRELNQDGKPQFAVSGYLKNGLSTEKAYESSLVQGKSLTQYVLDSDENQKQSEISFMDSKNGLMKFADDYASPNQFAVSGFELFDLTPNLPMSQFFHQGLMPIRVGGGFAETVSALRLSYKMAKMRLAGGNTNQAYTSDSLPEKITVPAYAFLYGLVIGEVDWMKSSSVAYDILGYKLEALRLSYQRELDYFAFLGNEGINGITSSNDDFAGGLLNQDYTNGYVGHEVASSDWNTWDVEDFVTKFIQIFTDLRVLNRFTAELIPDTVSFPTELWVRFAQPAVVGTVGASNGTGVVTSIFDYLKAQIRSVLGRDVNFVEVPYSSKNADSDYTTAGIVANGSTEEGRITFYKNSERAIRMNVTMPLIGGALAYSPTEFGYRQNHIAVVSTPMVVYPTTIYYLDNFASEYDVTYTLNSGTNDADNPATFVKSELPITLDPATQSLYTFNGWYTESTFENKITQLTKAKDYALFAKFTLTT